MDIKSKIRNYFYSNNRSVTLLEFISKKFELDKFSLKIKKKFITEGQIRVNKKIIKNPDYILKSGSIVSQGRITKKYVKTNSTEFDLDSFVNFLTHDLFEVESLKDIKADDSHIVFSYLVYFLQNVTFDHVKLSQTGRELDEFLRKYVNENGLIKELRLTKMQSKGRLLIDSLLGAFKTIEDSLKSELKLLKKGQYDSQLDSFLQNYNNILFSNVFKLIVEPITDPIVVSKVAIENLVKPLFAIDNISSENGKFQHYSKNKNTYPNYRNQAKESDSLYVNDIFIPLCDYLESLYKLKSKVVEEKSGKLFISLVNRRYNIGNVELSISFEVKNIGEGPAAQCHVGVQENSFFKGKDREKDLGYIQPSETRRIVLNVIKKKHEKFIPIVPLSVKWENANGIEKKQNVNLQLLIQDAEIPWLELKKKKPYSIKKIDNEDKLFGRDYILEELYDNALSDTIESYKIWGQKRVGKSSIVLTLRSKLKENKNVIVVYKEVSRNIVPIESLNELGEEISIELLDDILNKTTDINKSDRIRSVELPKFNGSLQPLERYIKNIHRIDNSLKFIFILDEFDRLNEEFFLPGNIGESFSLSIGKQISAYNYVGFILVGAENMSLLDYQEINYNSFEDQRVDTFDIEKDFEAYSNIIKKPVHPYIQFSDESVNEIFKITNGNPYFTNFICDKLFKSCFDRKDSEVDTVEVQKAVELIVNSEQKGHFAHFWGDGLNQDTDAKREKTTDIRRRILVAYSNLFNQKNSYPTKSDLLRTFNYPEAYSVNKDEVESIISSFFTRGIFFNEKKSKKIRIKPILFELWLCGKGRSLIIEGVTDLEAQERELENEEIAKIKDDEFERLSQNLKYKSNSIDINKLKSFLRQFGSNSDQRRIFTLLDNIFFVSHEEIVDFIKKEKKTLFGEEPIHVKDSAKTLFREGVEVYSSSWDKDENEVLFSTFKVLSKLRTTKTLKKLTDKRVWLNNRNTKSVIIFDPYISDVTVLSEELQEFLNINKKDLDEYETSMVLFSLVCTKKAKTKLLEILKPYSKSKLVILHELEEGMIKPFHENSIILENNTESQLILSSCRRIYSNTAKNEGLIVFENICPFESLKIFWKTSDQFAPLFPNEFGSNSVNTQNNPKGREELYKLNTKLSQRVNHYIVSYLKNISKKEDWLTIENVPRQIIEKVSARYLDSKEKEPKESFLDFIDYKEIVKKHNPLKNVLSINKDMGWFGKINELRRIPAHPEKSDPTEEQVEYFRKIHDTILQNIYNSPIIEDK